VRCVTGSRSRRGFQSHRPDEAEIARACLEAGANIIKDVIGFRRPAIDSVAKEFELVVL